ncbi:MAG: adenylate/guanylate cyclase domain-containing protein [Gammaproteobacteria bacterium]|nr:adenylate/guanylate cyclase domain-containing protein [Gammaproteobacteria bacterium]
MQKLAMGKQGMTAVLAVTVILIGIIFNQLPIQLVSERSLGLSLLFKLRGPLPAPTDVVLVSIDKSTADALDLSIELKTWPRRLHAKLIDNLARAGVAVTVFDIYFKGATRTEDDQALATSIGNAGNVVLFSQLQREVTPLLSSSDTAVTTIEINRDRMVAPFEPIAAEAAALALFPLPKVSLSVSQFWAFYAMDALPTLPAAALELFVLSDPGALFTVLDSLRPQQSGDIQQRFAATKSSSALALSLRSLFRNDPSLIHAVLAQFDKNAKKSHRLEALLNMYLADSRLDLNFYGPPHTITRVPYLDVLNGTEEALTKVRNKVVFVGYSGRFLPEQQDSFYTVFSQNNGLDISGVEIAAMAFSNLLHQQTLHPAPPVLFAIVYGLFITLVGYALAQRASAGVAIACMLLLSAAYFTVSYLLFARYQLWLPWVVPLLVQTPLVLIFTLLWQHKRVQARHDKIHHAFARFIPGTAVEQLGEHGAQLLSRAACAEAVFGVCMATDARQYTRLAESMDAQRLHVFMKRYYEGLFAPVSRHGGYVSDIVGDAMMAIWHAPETEWESPQLREAACQAALDIVAQEHRRLSQGGVVSLKTRIGIHCGEVSIGHIGAGDHYEYRAVGDTVNTASRIENLNKRLGTSILVSSETIENLSMLLSTRLSCSRELGDFQFVGKSTSINIHELLSTQGHCNDSIEAMTELFAKGLCAYRQQSWSVAISKFSELLRIVPDDGPARYYLQRCQDLTTCHPLSGWSGVIVLNEKD